MKMFFFNFGFLLGGILLIFVRDVSLQEYRVDGEFKKTKNGLSGYLVLVNDSSTSNSFPDPINRLYVQFFYETEDRLHLKITDAHSERWEVPGVVVSKTPSVSPSKVNYQVSILYEPSFSFTVTRLIDGKNIFQTSHNFPFFFCNQYIEMSSVLDTSSPNFYGLGERKEEFRLKTNSTYTLFTKDGHGTPYHVPLYGSHPFTLRLFDDGSSSGLFFLNSNAQDFWINGPEKFFRWRTIGGIIDIYFFMGSNPEDVIQQYHQVIGQPHLPAFWTLGNNQCRWGWFSVNHTRSIWEKFWEYDFPLDGMWNDIDYMDDLRDFTNNVISFPLDEYQSFINDIHAKNQKYVQIFDPGLKVEKGYYPYDYGVEKNIFIKESDGVTDIINLVWPGYTVFPDWWNNKTQSYWNELVSKHLKDIDLDGFWIDMNEPDGFCNGFCDYNNNNNNPFDNPPYIPPDLNDQVYEYTLSLSSKTAISELYNCHSLYGFMEGQTFLESWKQVHPNTRTLVLSRSTFSGQGRMTSHWYGDGSSTFEDLGFSLSNVLNFNLFGIPHSGADICGFEKWTNEELCTRYYQVGSFFGFMRNHNSIGCIPQEPWSFGEKMLNATRDVTRLRYTLLPYMYSLFYQVHVNGGTVHKPLWFEFNDNSKDIQNTIDLYTQLLVGKALMITPVVKEGERKVKMYLPKNAEFFDYYTGKSVLEDGCSSRQNWCVRDAPLDRINLHVRDGYIIPVKENYDMTTHDIRKNKKYGLVVALEEGSYGSSSPNNNTIISRGELFIDDGISFDSISSGKYSLIHFVATKTVSYNSDETINLQTTCKISSEVVKSGYTGGSGTDEMTMGSIRVFGVKVQVNNVSVNGKSWKSWKYDSKNHVLVIDGLDLTLLQSFSIIFS